MSRRFLRVLLRGATAFLCCFSTASPAESAQVRQADDRLVFLTPADVSPVVALSIEPSPDSTDGSLAFIFVSLSKKACQYPSEAFEVLVQTNATGFGLKRVFRADQRPASDGSCTESLTMRLLPLELQDLASAKSIVVHMIAGPLVFPEEARRFVASVTPRTTSKPPQDARDYASALQNLNVMLANGEIEKALELSEALAPLFRARPPEESITFFATLGKARRLNGDLDGAALGNEVALKIADASNLATPLVAVVYDNLATIRRFQKRWAAATTASDQALAIFERTVGVNDPTYGATLNNRAMLLFAQDDAKNALEYSERALDVLRKSVKDPDALMPFLEDNRLIREKLQPK